MEFYKNDRVVNLDILKSAMFDEIAELALLEKCDEVSLTNRILEMQGIINIIDKVGKLV